MAEKTYLVKREHEGDRPYAVGETRTVDEASVAHLVPHVLEPMKGKAKAEPKLKNKAEG